MQFDADVCALLDAAGLDARFRTIDEHAGGATASYCAADLTPDALHEQFVLENRPVILRDLHPGWTPHRWNDAHVRASCGDRSIRVRCADAAARFGDPGSSGMYTRKQLRVEEFLDSLADASASEGSPYYAAQLSLRRDLPELFADTLPEPPHLRAFGPLWRGSPAAYIGGATRTPLHIRCAGCPHFDACSPAPRFHTQRTPPRLRWECSRHRKPAVRRAWREKRAAVATGLRTTALPGRRRVRPLQSCGHLRARSAGLAVARARAAPRAAGAPRAGGRAVPAMRLVACGADDAAA